MEAVAKFRMRDDALTAHWTFLPPPRGAAAACRFRREASATGERRLRDDQAQRLKTSYRHCRPKAG